MKVNRIWLIAGALLIASAYYEARLKPQSRPIYERALVHYRQEDFARSLAELEQAYAIEPNSTAILVLMGWNQLKLNQLAAAQENFSRAVRLDPGLTEARLGLAYLGVQSGQTQVRVEEIQALLAQDPRNRDYQLAAAAMLRQAGQNRQAAAIFRGMLGQDRYGEVARRNLEQIGALGANTVRAFTILPPAFYRALRRHN
ncbi:MAG: hypothetical protein HW398_147, partial [Acidobacteria bacterium]|nr:hypothetical protein [Acidobacteriota bacterium]